MSKELLFSVTKKDLRIDTFRVGGNGGQHRDKTSAGVRITHLESGAVGTCSEHREQRRNRDVALRRMTEHPRWRMWHARMVEASLGRKTVEETVDEAMTPENIKIECHDEEGRWVEVERLED